MAKKKSLGSKLWGTTKRHYRTSQRASQTMGKGRRSGGGDGGRDDAAEAARIAEIKKTYSW